MAEVIRHECCSVENSAGAGQEVAVTAAIVELQSYMMKRKQRQLML